MGSHDLAQTPEDGRSLFRRAAQWTGKHGILVMTGAAPGADQLAAAVALQAGGRVLLVLPWPDFERDFVMTMKSAHGARMVLLVFDEKAHDHWLRTSISLHPDGLALGSEAVKRHARNYGIVERAEALIALPSPRSEGTAQAIRIAQHLAIPVFNFSTADGRKDWTQYQREVSRGINKTRSQSRPRA